MPTLGLCLCTVHHSALSRQGINQQDIEANLRSLPIFLSGCETLLLLCGTTYLSRCLLKHRAAVDLYVSTWLGDWTFRTARSLSAKEP